MFRFPLSALFLIASTTSLFASADLHLRAEPAETRLPTSASFSLRLDISNFGPDAALDVKLHVTGTGSLVPRQLPVNCSAGVGDVLCSLGDVPAGVSGERSITLFFEGPLKSASANLTATVSSREEDPVPANNSITRAYEFVEAVDFFGEITVSSRRADPGDLTRVTTSLQNWIDSDPRDVRIYYELDRGTISSIDADARWSCTTSGARAECFAASLDPGCRCSRDIVLNVHVPDDPFGGAPTLRMFATSSLPDFFQPMRREAKLSVWRWLMVTTTAPSGPGSLRDTIWQVNDECLDVPCKIAFAIDSSALTDGVAVITPAEPLPVILADNVHLDGGTQSMHAGDSNPVGPEVVIDGRRLASGRGVEIHSSCDAIITGLAIVNFPDEAIVYDNRSRCTTTADREIRGNYIGVDPSGTVAMPNRRGIYASGEYASVVENVVSGNTRAGIWADSRFFRAERNRIGTSSDGLAPLPNGASGIYISPRNQWAEILTNTISWNEQMGVAVARSASYVDIRQNAMRNNGGLGIDVGLDGRDPLRDDEIQQSNPPVLLSAIYDEQSGTTTISGTLESDPLGPYGNAVQIDLYANAGPDGDGEEWIAYSWSAPIRADGTPFTLSVARDLRGKWINATSTRVHFIASRPPDVRAWSTTVGPDAIAGGDAKTSELSVAIPVASR